MRIDLPCCGFKNCRYCFDGNCTKPSKQEKCEYWYLLHEEPEVIRCKDCKHYAPEVGDDSYALGYCPFIGRHLVMSKGFCAWGERRGEKE